MKGKRDHKRLVDPLEIVELFDRFGTSEAIADGAAIFYEWQEHGKKSTDRLFDSLCLLGAVFEAGRIQGIREERRRRREGSRP